MDYLGELSRVSTEELKTDAIHLTVRHYCAGKPKLISGVFGSLRHKQLPLIDSDGIPRRGSLKFEEASSMTKNAAKGRNGGLFLSSLRNATGAGIGTTSLAGRGSLREILSLGGT